MRASFHEACLYYFREQTKKFVGIKFNKLTQEISPKDSYYAMDFTPTISIGHIVKIFSCLQISLDVRISMKIWNTCRLYELLFGLLNSCLYCSNSCISNSTSNQVKRTFAYLFFRVFCHVGCCYAILVCAFLNCIFCNLAVCKYVRIYTRMVTYFNVLCTPVSPNARNICIENFNVLLTS